MENNRLKTVGQVFTIVLALTMLSSMIVIGVPQQSHKIIMVETNDAVQLQKMVDSGAKILVDYNNGYTMMEVNDGYGLTLEAEGIGVDYMTERTVVTPGVADISFDWTAGDPDIPAELQAPANADAYIVKFIGPIQSNLWIDDIRDLGGTIHSYVPSYGLVVRMDDSAKAAVSTLPTVEWVGDYHPAYKISPGIEIGAGTVMAEAHAFEGVDVALLSGKLNEMGVTINQYVPGDFTVKFTADSSLIPAIASLPEIEQMYPDSPIHTMDLKANEVHGSVDAWYPSWSGLDQALDGSGEVVGIQDTGLDEGSQDDGHCDFFDGPDGDRVIRFQDDTTYSIPDGDAGGVSHGTHCAGLVMANGWCWETWKGESTIDQVWHKAQSVGVLPRAEISFDGISASAGGLTPNTGNWNQQYGDGARAMSNSWGGGNGGYGGDSGTADTQMDGDTRIILFAIGNDGPDEGSIAQTSQAKNGLCVGAGQNFRPDQFSSDNPNLVVDFSGRGSSGITYGRIKPDLIAVGTSCISCFCRGEWDYNVGTIGNPQPSFIMDCDEYRYQIPGPGQDGRPDYQYMQGTSMACPVAAGEYLMVREYLREVGGIGAPGSELTKAMLINGCVKMKEELYTYPGYDQGWGRINVKNSLFPDLPTTVKYETHTFASTGTWSPTFSTNVVSDDVPLKISLVWKDVTGAALSRDVDLQVTAPDATLFRGNCFSGYPYWSTTGAANRPDAKANNYDGDNNVEQVWIENPTSYGGAGTWSITLSCTDTNGNVPCAVVMSADIGPQETYAVDLTTEYPTTFSVVANGEANFQFNVLNFGTAANDDILMSDDSPFTISYSPASPFHLDSTESVDVVATISAGAIAAGLYEFKLTGTSQGDPTEFDNIFLTVEVLNQRLPFQYEVTTESLDEIDPAVVTFTDQGGTSRIFISYIKTTASGNRIFVAYDTLQLDGTPTESWTHLEITAPSPDYEFPNDPRIYVMSGGAYLDRVFIVWTGDQVGATENRESSSWISYASYGSYGSWSTVFIDRNTGSNTCNFKRVNSLACLAGSNELVYVFEHLDYADPPVNPSAVQSHARVSSNGGASWGAATLLTPADSNYYFFPNVNSDQNGVAWVWFYWRPQSGVGSNSRNLCVKLYDGSWQSGNTPVWDEAPEGDNIQFPAGWSTTEGGGNRNYCAVMRDQGTTTLTVWTCYIDGDFTSGSPPPDSTNGWANAEGPLGTAVSDANYNRRPVLAAAQTGDGYNWIAYMEKDNPYGVPNMDTVETNNGFAAVTYYRCTADSYAKGHQMVSALSLGGDNMYEVFHSSHGTVTDVDYNVYLMIFHHDWPNDPDTEGPVATAVMGNPNPAPEGGLFDISANIDDTTTGFSGIQAAQYIVGPLNSGPTDTPGWPGTGMTVSGGSQTETATATGVSVPGVDGDYFYIYVRGQDTLSNWGEGGYCRVDVVFVGGDPLPISSCTYSGASPTPTSPITIDWSATDNNGLTQVELFYQYNGGGYASWVDASNPTAAVGVADSGSWSFGFSDGPGIYDFYTRATDDAAQTEAAPGTPDVTVEYAPPLPYDVDLSGVAVDTWVFVSFPTEISGVVPTIFDDTAFGDGATDWDYVQWYDNLNKEWRSYSTDKPAPINDMDVIDNTNGFWIHITSNGGDFQLTTGLEGFYSAGTVNINLYTGWNLVGYPSATPRAGDVTLPAEANLVSVYDLGEAYRIRDELKSAVIFTEGNAYWVRVTANCVWQVNP